MEAPFYEQETKFSLRFKDWPNPIYFNVDKVEPFVLYINPGSTSGNYGYFSSSVSAGSYMSSWYEVIDANADNVLEPDNEFEIWHCGWAIKPSCVEMYMKYPSNVLMGSMGNQAPLLDGKWGGIPGEVSPFEMPNFEATEFFTTKHNHPAFNVYNPTTEALAVKVRFGIAKYKVSVLEPTATLKATAVSRSIGDPGSVPAPSWLVNKIQASTTLNSLYTKVV